MIRGFISSDSSLISKVSYNYDTEELDVYFVETYFIDKITYLNVPSIIYEEMSENRINSFGKFYLEQIKPFFKQKLKLKKMSETKQKPKGVNIASDKKRFIKQRINLSKINKEYLFKGKDGDIYLDQTLHLLPDGEVDRYENLGMITQDVPKEIYSKDKNIRGEILGNARENLWESDNNAESIPGVDLPTLDDSDDLPF